MTSTDPPAAPGPQNANATGARVPFTGMVVCWNEAKRLRECLQSLQFCDDLFVIDLGSEDDSREIAASCGAQVIGGERRPIVEKVWAEQMHRVRTDWVILIDPDEVLPPGVEEHFAQKIAEEPDAAIITVPYAMYYCGKLLTCTHWGRPGNRRPTAHHVGRVTFAGDVHAGRQIKPGFEMAHLSREEAGAIKHYWIESRAQLIEKHERYLEHEGEARHNQGLRFGWWRAAWDTFTKLRRSLFRYRGITGGRRGIYLSFFFARYTWRAWLALRRYERSGMAADERG